MVETTATASGFTAPQARSGDRRRQGTLVAVALLFLIALISSPLFQGGVARGAPKAERGVLRLAEGAETPVSLAGDWRVFWNGVLAGSPDPGGARIVAVPGRWSDAQADGKAPLPETGLASYRLDVVGLRPGAYLLHLPLTYTATELWVDGRRVSSAGRVDPDPQRVRYQVRSHDVPVRVDGDRVRIQIDMAAQLHRDNGPESSPVFGSAEAMRIWIARQWAKAFLQLAALLLLVVQGLVLWVHRPEDRAPLYLALNCLVVLPQAAIFAHDNILLIAIPELSFLRMLGLQYIGGVIGMPLLLLYTSSLFPRETWRPALLGLFAAFAGLAVVQSALLLAGNSMVASQVSQISTLTSVIALLFIMVVVARAARQGRDGAATFLVGVSSYALMILLKAGTTNGVFQASQLGGLEWLPLGVLLLLFSQVILLAQRSSSAIAAAEEMTDDVKRLIEVTSSINEQMQLEALLHRIVEAAGRIVDAERGTLFLFDESTGKLWSLVAQGLGDKRIELAPDQGLAGHAFTTGEPIIVENAYADARFDHRIDQETGYVSRSVLTLPIVTRDGRRLGVLQALNRRGGRGFDEEDVRRMGAFAAQAAIAIDNARLFTEVVQSRNYNESILRSMSTAVITLHAGAKVAKFNAAACRILAIDERLLEGADARRLLAYGNESLVPEVDDVIRTGRSKLLYDIDLRNGRDEIVSVNITIVPLLDAEGASEGVLVLIDDISEGKRLQGTMSRFLPQAVVEQVLAHPDELLFGSSGIASVLFTDIRNFTTIAEDMSPRETVEMLNEIFSDLFELVTANDGIVDKFMGDAVMAVFGAPIPSDRDAEQAVRAALGMQLCLQPLNTRRGAAGQRPIRLGTGIATGDVVSGTIGSPKRMDYTVIGDRVNLAARLQDLTKAYQVSVLICEHTAEAVAGRFALRELDLIRVRGRKAPGRLFEVRGETLSPADVPLMEGYEEARQAMTRRDWQAAIARLETLALAFPEDGPTRVMLDRAHSLAAAPPPAGWDGVWNGRQAA